MRLYGSRLYLSAAKLLLYIADARFQLRSADAERAEADLEDARALIGLLRSAHGDDRVRIPRLWSDSENAWEAILEAVSGPRAPTLKRPDVARSPTRQGELELPLVELSAYVDRAIAWLVLDQPSLADEALRSADRCVRWTEPRSSSERRRGPRRRNTWARC